MIEQSSKARDQSANRRWSKHGDSYMFSVRIQGELLQTFKAYCEENHESPSVVMRAALRSYLTQVRPKARPFRSLTEQLRDHERKQLENSSKS